MLECGQYQKKYEVGKRNKGNTKWDLGAWGAILSLVIKKDPTERDDI